MIEMEHLFEADRSGFVISEGKAAVQEKFNNWINTLRGTFLGRPEWGHELRKFLFEPPTETLAMLMEADLIDTLAVDLPQIEIIGVRSKPALWDDCYYLQVDYRVLGEDLEGTINATFQVGG